MKFTNAETAVLLASMRLFQESLQKKVGFPARIADILDDGGALGVTGDQIDILCDKVNA